MVLSVAGGADIGAERLVRGTERALRKAQLELLHGGPLSNTAVRGFSLHEGAEKVEASKFRADPDAPFAHPYYWAAFFLMGNWL